MKQYNEVLKELQKTINTARNKNTADNFKRCLKDLKVYFDVELSTKFLRNLVSKTKNPRHKTHRISYLLRRCGLKTKRTYKYYDELATQKYNIEIIDYTTNKNKPVYSEFCSLTDDEQQQLKEIEEVKIKTGIELKPRAREDLNIRQNLRDNINLGGSVYMKSWKSQTIGKYFKTHLKQVFFFVEGF